MPVDLPEPRSVKPELWANVPRLLRFLALHLALGAAAGVAFAAIVIMSNVSGIKTLIAESANPYLVLVLLYGSNVLTFGSLAMAIGVMTLPFDGGCDMSDPEDRDDDKDGPAGH